MAANKKSASKKKDPTFEEATSELEEITQQLESNDSSLDELLEKFERGQQLLKLCQDTLGAARKRLEVIEAAAESASKSAPVVEHEQSSNDDDVRLF